MEEKTVYPTNHCFTDAMEFLDGLARLGTLPYDGSVILVHALCTFADGTLFAHAWVEDRLMRTAIFKGKLDGEESYFERDLGEHRESLKIVDQVEYLPQDAARENFRTGFMGPWDPRFDPYLRKAEASCASASS